VYKKAANRKPLKAAIYYKAKCFSSASGTEGLQFFAVVWQAQALF